MRKQTKLVAVLSATALLAIGAAMTSFAATGWVDEGGEWVYYDADEDMVTDSWKKSGDNWYYLDEDGYMAREKKVDEYYVNESGVMVKNAWAEVNADDVDEDDPEAPDTYWYYFGNSGKYTTGWKSVNGAWYYFNDEGIMQTGWLEDGDKTYYLGEEGDGAMKTQWQYLEERNDDDDTTSPSDSEVWYWFGSNGKLVSGEVKKINGKYYALDDEGKMLDGWVNCPSATAPNAIDDNNRSDYSMNTDIRYFNEDGSRASGWAKVATLEDPDSNAWYYFSSGRAYYSVGTDKKGSVIGTNAKGDRTYCKVTISNKIYAFDDRGRMKSGLLELKNASGSDAVYYFSNSSDTDGSMKTGKQNVYDEDDDETYVYYFDTKATTKGLGITGVKDNYLYENGKRVEAQDGAKYEKVTVKGKDYLVNESGKLKTSGVVKNGDDMYIGVKKGSDGDYIVTGEYTTKADAEAALK